MSRTSLHTFVFFAGAFVLFMCFAPNALSCSYRAKPLANFPEQYVVLVGTVVGYSEPIPIPRRAGTEEHTGGEKGSWYEAQGYRLQVNESLRMTAGKSQIVDVFEFFRSPVCEPLGLTEPIISNRYPLGSELAIVAEPARTIQMTSGRLEILEVPPAGGAIFNISTLPKSSRPTFASEFDYSTNIYPHDLPWPLLRVEVLKDLYRLRTTTDKNTKRQILTRVMGLKDGMRLIDYYPMLLANTSSPADARDLYIEMLRHDNVDEKVIRERLKGIENTEKKTKADRP
jgi:hypothetical protein